MIRLLDLTLIGAAIAGAVWTYQIKHQAELSAHKVTVLKRQIAAQNRKIALFEADWALESSPARMEQIAEKYAEQLKLKPMRSTQIIDTSELPGLREDRKAKQETVIASDDDGTEVKPDDTLTGGIEDLIGREGEN